MSGNPCTRCGACCASFRVDFAREELRSAGGSVPDGLTVALNTTLCRMRGTDHAHPRCAALVGRVGEQASCGIHEWRPGPCREFGLRAPKASATKPAHGPAHGMACSRCRCRCRRHPVPSNYFSCQLITRRLSSRR